MQKVKGSKTYNIKVDGFDEPLEPILKRALREPFHNMIDYLHNPNFHAQLFDFDET